jgi:hypothetical protein
VEKKMSYPVTIDVLMLEFLCRQVVKIEFFSDPAGTNVMVTHLTKKRELHGHVCTIGSKRPLDGRPHTVESAIAECVARLMMAFAEREGSDGVQQAS